MLRRLAARRVMQAMTTGALLTAGSVLTQPANATPYYWSVGGATPAAGGTGTWDLVTANWLSGSATGPASLYGNGAADGAIFGGTAGTVTLATGITINANFLNFLTTGYTVTTGPLAFGTGTTNATLNFSGTAPIVDTGTFNETLSGLLTGGGFTKNGSGTLTLAATTGTITGATTTSASNIVTVTDSTNGILVGMPVSGAGITAGSTVTSITDATHFVISANVTTGTTGTVTLSSIDSFTGDIVINSGGMTASSVIRSTGGLVKNGTGTATLSGIDSFSGATGVSVNNGTLITDESALPTGSQVLPNTTVLNMGGGTLNIKTATGTDISSIGTLNVNAGGSTIILSRFASSRLVAVLGSAASGTSAFRSAGGTLNFTNFVNSGTTKAAPRLPTAATVNGVIPWATANGTDWVVSAGPNNDASIYAGYTASTTTSLGTALQNSTVGTDVALPTGSNTINTIRFNDAAAGHTITIGTGQPGDSLIVGAGGILETAAVAAHSELFTGGTLEGGAPGSGSGQDLIIIQNNTNASGGMFIASTIADNPTGVVIGGNNVTATALTKSGAGNLTLSNAANTYTGNTYLNGGVTQIAADGSLGATASTIVFTGGTLQLSPTYTGSTLSRNITMNDLGGTIDTNGINVTDGGTISAGTGLGGFTKAGTGVLTLTSANAYTGSTTVSAGNLALGAAGTTGSGAVNVSSGAALSGAGTAAGAVTITGGGILAPGLNTNTTGTFGSAGALTVGSLNLSSTTSTLDFDLTTGSSTAASSVNDKVNVTGALTITGGAFNFSGTGAGTTNSVYNLFSYGSLTNAFNQNAFTISSGNTGGLSYTFGNDTVNKFITLTITGTAAPTSTWNVDANGNWSLASNWNPQVVPHNPGDQAVFGSIITAPRTITLDGSETVGLLTFSNANAYTIAPGSGTLTINNGANAASITDANGSHFITVPMTLSSSTVATVTNAGDTLTISGAVNGTGTLTKSGSGTLALSGANSYGPAAGTVGTTLGAGTLQVGTNSALGAGDVAVSSATLQAGAATLSLANNMTIANGSTETVDTQANSLTLSGVLSDVSSGGSLTKIGAGTLVLAGNNTYAGATTISAGTLQLGAGGASGSVAGNIVDNAALALNRTDNLTLGNVISGTGTLNQNGTNNVTLTGTNTFSGVTTINAGTLTLSAPAAGTTSLALQNSTLNFSSGTLNFDTAITAATLGGLTGTLASQNLALTNTNAAPAAVALTVNNAVANAYAGSLSGAGSLTKTGAGTLTLSGANTYTGTTTLSAGSLTLTGSIGTAGTPSGAVTINANAGTFTLTGGSLYAASLTQNNPSTVVLNGTTVLTGALAAAANNANNAGVISMTGGTVHVNSISTGRTALNDGTLPAAGTTTDGVYINGAAVTVDTTVSLGNGTGTNSSPNLRMDSGSLTVAGTTTLQINNGTRFAILDVNGGAYTSTDATAGGGIVIGGVFAGTEGELLVRGTGTVTAPTITMGNALQTSGTDALVVNGAAATLYVGSGGIIQATGSTVVPTINLTAGTVGATADWSSALPATVGTTAANGVTFKAADASNNAHNITISGVLSGTGIVTKTGGGTLTLGGTTAAPGTVANTYSGGTVITAGTVAVSTGLASGGGSAVGSGTVTFSGGKLQNANLTGSNTTNTQTTGMASLTTGTSSVLDFGSGNTGAVFSFASFDIVNTGSLTILNDASAVAGVAGTGGGNDQLFFGTTQAYSNAQLSNVTFNLGGNNYGATQLASGEIVSNGIAAAPEPSQWVAFGLGILGLGGLGLRARRRMANGSALSA